MSASGATVLDPPFHQCALVVADLDEAVRHWYHNLGIGPWTAYHLRPPLLRDMVYRGQPVEFAIRHALAWQGNIQFELVEPLGGPSIFADHLAEHGPGLHHLGKIVPDHPVAVAQAIETGWVPLQSARGFGAEGDGAFAYFEVPGIASVVELIEPPRIRIEPDFVYPLANG